MMTTHEDLLYQMASLGLDEFLFSYLSEESSCHDSLRLIHAGQDGVDTGDHLGDKRWLMLDHQPDSIQQ